MCWERLKGFTRSRTYKVLTDVTHFLLGVLITTSILLGDVMVRCLSIYGIVCFILYQLLESEDLDECTEDLAEFMLGLVLAPVMMVILRVLGWG